MELCLENVEHGLAVASAVDAGEDYRQGYE